jgi:hypothetical protein
MRILSELFRPYLLLRNRVDYPLRTRLRFARPVDHVQPAGLEAALEGLAEPDRLRALQLIDGYDLRPLVLRGRRRDVRENLYYLDMLLTAFERSGVELPPHSTRAVDVGVSDWFYAPALHGLLRRHHTERPREVELLGFEADPGRRYADGHTREDWAAWHSQGLAGARYVPEDARRWSGTVDLATMLFPFLFPRDVDRWGLPRSLHRPAELLGHVWSCVGPGGSLVVVNQGEAERDLQRQLLAEVGAPVAWSGPFESPFWRYDFPRFVHVASKRSSTSMPNPGRSENT